MPKRYNVQKTKKGTAIFTNRPDSRMWYYRARYGSIDTGFPLGNDLKKARKLADEIRDYLVFHTVEQTRQRFYPSERLIAPHVPTIKEVMSWVNRAAHINGVSGITADHYEQTLKRLASFYAPAHPKRKQQKLLLQRALNKPITCLTPQVWAALVSEAFNMRGKTAKTKRALNFHLHNLKSMFSKKYVNLFPFWDPEWLEPLLSIPVFTRVAAKYRLPDENLVAETFLRIEAMEMGPEKAALTLALRAGLRRSEIAYARKDWVELGPKVSRIFVMETPEFTPKGTPGYTEIETRFIEPILSLSTEFLVGVERISERVDRIPTNAVAHLRDWGWEVANPLHALRKLYGALVASTRGLYTAQVLLRHSQAQLTSDSYADLVTSDRLLKLWDADIGKTLGNRPRSSGVTQLLLDAQSG